MYTHCSELKRRLKAEQKAKEKAEKEASKAAADAAAPANKCTNKSQLKDLEEISPNEYFKLRSAAVAELKKSPETHPYPHKFHVSISLENFISKYNHLNEGEMLEKDELR